MVSFSSRGSFQNTENFLNRMRRKDIFAALDAYAREGVEALSSATPVRSGETASSWGYEIKKSLTTYSIHWTNSHVDSQGQPIAILLQYGHGTGTGGYVQGIDYINPVIKPIFDKIASQVWKAVTSA